MSAPIRRVTLLLLVVMLFAAMMPTLTALAQSPEPIATVNTGVLNVRSGPGLNYGAIATLPQGFGVRMIARNAQANWVLIELTNGLRGWVNINYLFTTYRVSQLPVDETIPATDITPTARNQAGIGLNVRSDPGPEAAVVGVLNPGDLAALLGRNYNSSWARIRLPNGVEGWVVANNIAGTVPVRSLSPADGSIVGPVPPTTGTGTNRPPAAGAPGQGSFYTVRRGDTLGAIARRNNINVYELARLNGIVNINLIYAGQRLYIP